MMTYLTLFGIPEWKMLSRVQRKLVCKRCILPLLFRWQVWVARTCLLLVAILGMKALLHPPSGWREFTTGFVVALVASSLFDLFVIASNRRQIIQFVQGHGQELELAA
jgi:hypothetical protein